MQDGPTYSTLKNKPTVNSRTPLSEVFEEVEAVRVQMDFAGCTLSGTELMRRRKGKAVTGQTPAAKEPPVQHVMTLLAATTETQTLSVADLWLNDGHVPAGPLGQVLAMFKLAGPKLILAGENVPQSMHPIKPVNEWGLTSFDGLDRGTALENPGYGAGVSFEGRLHLEPTADPLGQFIRLARSLLPKSGAKPPLVSGTITVPTDGVSYLGLTWKKENDKGAPPVVLELDSAFRLELLELGINTHFDKSRQAIRSLSGHALLTVSGLDIHIHLALNLAGKSARLGALPDLAVGLQWLQSLGDGVGDTFKEVLKDLSKVRLRLIEISGEISWADGLEVTHLGLIIAVESTEGIGVPFAGGRLSPRFSIFLDRVDGKMQAEVEAIGRLDWKNFALDAQVASTGLFGCTLSVMEQKDFFAEQFLDGQKGEDAVKPATAPAPAAVVSSSPAPPQAPAQPDAEPAEMETVAEFFVGGDFRKETFQFQATSPKWYYFPVGDQKDAPKLGIGELYCNGSFQFSQPDDWNVELGGQADLFGAAKVYLDGSYERRGRENTLELTLEAKEVDFKKLWGVARGLKELLTGNSSSQSSLPLLKTGEVSGKLVKVPGDKLWKLTAAKLADGTEVCGTLEVEDTEVQMLKAHPEITIKGWLDEGTVKDGKVVAGKLSKLVLESLPFPQTLEWKEPTEKLANVSLEWKRETAFEKPKKDAPPEAEKQLKTTSEFKLKGELNLPLFGQVKLKSLEVEVLDKKSSFKTVLSLGGEQKVTLEVKREEKEGKKDGDPDTWELQLSGKAESLNVGALVGCFTGKDGSPSLLAKKIEITYKLTSEGAKTLTFLVYLEAKTADKDKDKDKDGKEAAKKKNDGLSAGTKLILCATKPAKGKGDTEEPEWCLGVIGAVQIQGRNLPLVSEFVGEKGLDLEAGLLYFNRGNQEFKKPGRDDFDKLFKPVLAAPWESEAQRNESAAEKEKRESAEKIELDKADKKITDAEAKNQGETDEAHATRKADAAKERQSLLETRRRGSAWETALTGVAQTLRKDKSAWKAYGKVSLDLDLTSGRQEHDVKMADAQTAAAEPPSAPAASVAEAAKKDEMSWTELNKTLGPLFLNRMGYGTGEGKLRIAFDGGLDLKVLKLTAYGLGLDVEFPSFNVTPRLDGLGIDVKRGPVVIAGTLIHQNGTYKGSATIKIGAFGLSAIGRFSMVDGRPSLFIFCKTDMPLGGPPAFFVESLAGGMGYDSRLVLPRVEDVDKFCLMQVMNSEGDLSGAMTAMDKDIVPSPGNCWFAAGVKFTTFKMMTSSVLVSVSLGDKFTVDLFGVSCLKVGKKLADGSLGVVLAQIDLNIRGQFSPADGVVWLEGRIMPTSFVFDKSCQIEGGFAFYSWFDGPHKGDFVITAGGYDPEFEILPHYPKVPRFRLSWDISSNLSVKGEAYFALTPQAIMAGGRLEMLWQSSSVRASFVAYARFLMYWHPFKYLAEIGVAVEAEAQVDTWVAKFTLKVHASARLKLQGPPFRVEAEIDLDVLTLKVNFGAAPEPPKDLTWLEFKRQFLPEKNILTVRSSQGDLTKNEPLRLVDGKLDIEIGTVIPLMECVHECKAPASSPFSEGVSKDFAMRPMGEKKHYHARLVVDLPRSLADELDTIWQYDYPVEALWSPKATTETPSLAQPQNRPKALTGMKLVRKPVMAKPIEHVQKFQQGIHTLPAAFFVKPAQLRWHRDDNAWKQLLS